MNSLDHRYALQDQAYAFPYHYLPVVNDGTAPAVSRTLSWGFEYLTYMSWVRDAVAARAPGAILDVGCGDGRMVHLLDGVVDRRVGVDPSQQAIAFARAFNPRAEFVVGTATDVSEVFDVVTCVETLEHIPDEAVEDFVASLADRVRAGGALIVSVPSTARPVHKKHYRHYTSELLRSQLSEYFEEEEHRYLYWETLWTRNLNRLLANRWWTLNIATLRRLLWKLHERRSYFAPEGKGTHVVGVFRRAGIARQG